MLIHTDPLTIWPQELDPLLKAAVILGIQLTAKKSKFGKSISNNPYYVYIVTVTNLQDKECREK